MAEGILILLTLLELGSPPYSGSTYSSLMHITIDS